MKKFNKIKHIVKPPLNENRSFRKQEDDEIRKVTRDLEDQRRAQQQQDTLKATGDEPDQQQRAPVNPDGSPVNIDDIENRKPEKSLDGVGGTGYSKIGIGTHGSEKRRGILPGLMRGAGRLKSMADVAKKGAPVLPVAEDLYEDEEGNLRRFGKITTARAAGNPYYFEFDHYDKASKQNLVLYGTAPGSTTEGSDLQPIQLKVKTIVPSDKKDVRPMTAPTDKNVQPNFVKEGTKRGADGRFAKGNQSGAQYASKADSTTTTNAPQIDSINADGSSKVHQPAGKYVRGVDGRFAKGTQAGVQYSGGSAKDAMNPPAIIPGGNMPPAEVKNYARKISTGSSGSGGHNKSPTSSGGSTSSGSTSAPNYGTHVHSHTPQYSKSDNDKVIIPKNLWYHPTVQRMVKRFTVMNKQARRIKVGGHYGTLVRSDPGDGDSRLKLVRKIPRSYIPKIFLDDDFIAEVINIAPLPPNIPSGQGMAALGYGLVQSGLSISATRNQAITAIGNLGSSTPALGHSGSSTPALGHSSGSYINTGSSGSSSGSSGGSPLALGNSLQESLTTNNKLENLIHGLDEGFIDWLGDTLGKSYNAANRVFRKIKIGYKKAARRFEKQTGVKLNDIDKQNILNHVKYYTGMDAHAHERPEWASDIKGGPDDSDIDPDDNVEFVGSDYPAPSDTSSPPSSSPETVPDPVKSTEREPGEPDVDEGMSDEKLERYITSLITGYTKCTLAKPSPSAMLNSPTKDVVQEADILDVLGRIANDQTKNAFKHFAGWGFWPDFTEQDLKVLFVDTDYGSRVMGPSKNFAYRDEKERQSVRDQFKNKAMEIRTELGEYYNVNTWKGPTGQLIGLSDHSDLIWGNAEGEFFQRPDPKNPPKYWRGSREKYTAPAGLNKYDSVLQYLARDIYTRYKVNILSPSYQFKLKHFKEDVEDEPTSHDIKYNPGAQKQPNSTHSGPKRGKFFSKQAPGPGQFGSALPKKSYKQSKETDKDKMTRRRRRGRKRLEESFDIIRKLVIGN